MQQQHGNVLTVNKTKLPWEVIQSSSEVICIDASPKDSTGCPDFVHILKL